MIIKRWTYEYRCPSHVLGGGEFGGWSGWRCTLRLHTFWTRRGVKSWIARMAIVDRHSQTQRRPMRR